MSLKIRKLLFSCVVRVRVRCFSLSLDALSKAAAAQPTPKQNQSARRRSCRAPRRSAGGQKLLQRAGAGRLRQRWCCTARARLLRCRCSITTTYQTETKQFSCQVYGYTNASNQIKVPLTVTLRN